MSHPHSILETVRVVLVYGWSLCVEASKQRIGPARPLLVGVVDAGGVGEVGDGGSAEEGTQLAVGWKRWIHVGRRSAETTS